MIEPGEKRIYYTYLCRTMQQENQALYRKKTGSRPVYFIISVLSYKAVRTGAPGGSRTHDLWLRRPTLYPAELRAQLGLWQIVHGERAARYELLVNCYRRTRSIKPSAALEAIPSGACLPASSNRR